MTFSRNISLDEVSFDEVSRIGPDSSLAQPETSETIKRDVTIDIEIANGLCGLAPFHILQFRLLSHFVYTYPSLSLMEYDMEEGEGTWFD